MTVGERIRQARIAKEMSQTELAERARYSDKTRISKIEHAGNDVSMKQVRRIAKALGVSASYLMGWETAPAIAVTEPGTMLTVEFPEYNFEEDKQSKEFIELFQSVSPDVQETVLRFLKSAKQEP